MKVAGWRVVISMSGRDLRTNYVPPFTVNFCPEALTKPVTALLPPLVVVVPPPLLGVVVVAAPVD